MPRSSSAEFLEVVDTMHREHLAKATTAPENDPEILSLLDEFDDEAGIEELANNGEVECAVEELNFD